MVQYLIILRNGVAGSEGLIVLVLLYLIALFQKRTTTSLIYPKGKSGNTTGKFEKDPYNKIGLNVYVREPD